MQSQYRTGSQPQDLKDLHGSPGYRKRNNTNLDTKQETVDLVFTPCDDRLYFTQRVPHDRYPFTILHLF